MTAPAAAHLRHHLRMVAGMADDPQLEFRAALALSELHPTPLVECVLCGTVGLPERIHGLACPHE